MNQVPEWVKSSVFYQIFPDRFAYTATKNTIEGKYENWSQKPTPFSYKGGNLRGVIDKLPYFQELGVNALYLTPIFQSTSNHRYHTHDFYQIDPILGTMDDFQELLKKAHDRNIKIVLDGVFNHASRGFYYFNDVLENGEDSPWKDWFYIRKFPLNPYGEGDCGYECWWDLPALPKLNHNNPDVREYFMRVGEFWIRQGIDGWRLDVPHEIEVDGFWEEFRQRVRAINSEAYLLGEIWADASSWLQGDRFDAVMNYELLELIIQFIAGENVDRNLLHENHQSLGKLSAKEFSSNLKDIMSKYPWENTLSQYNLLGSHDVARFLSMTNQDKKLFVLANLLLFCLPGVPSIYYGDEVGLTGGRDPDCRKGFPDESHWDKDIFESMKSIIALRQKHPALQKGVIKNIHPLNQKSFSFTRQSDEEQIICIFNASDTLEKISLPDHHHKHTKVLFDTSMTLGSMVERKIELPPKSAIILMP